jgi:hypothetical protein
MSLVRSFFTLAIDGRISGIVRGVLRNRSFLLEALLSGPSFDQGPINREMLVRQQTLCAGMNQDSFKEGSGAIAFKQAVSILAENRGIPNGIIHTQSHKPAEQQVVIKLFDEEPFTTNGVPDLKQKCSQKLFRRHRRTPGFGIQSFKERGQVVQNNVNQAANGSQEMVLGNSAFPPKCNGTSSFAVRPFRASISSS